MSISYEFSLDEDLLVVTASGKDDSLDEVQAYGAAILAEAVKSGCHKVLCDERALIYALGVFDMFEAAKYAVQVAPKVARIAMVSSPEQMADLQFWETVATNRGLQVRTFHDIDEAKAWLKSLPSNSA